MKKEMWELLQRVAGKYGPWSYTVGTTILGEQVLCRGCFDVIARGERAIRETLIGILDGEDEGGLYCEEV